MPEKLRVVIIEDNQDAADSLGVALGFCGYDVKVAYTGPEGIDLVKSTQPSAVICDIGLPGLDGFAVAKALRADPETAPTPLIALTGYQQDEFRQLAHQAGFTHHMVKPADFATLLNWLPKTAV